MVSNWVCYCYKATYAIHAKLRLILHDYCAPFVEADVAMMHRLGAAAEKDLHGHERFLLVLERLLRRMRVTRRLPQQ